MNVNKLSSHTTGRLVESAAIAMVFPEPPPSYSSEPQPAVAASVTARLGKHSACTSTGSQGDRVRLDRALMLFHQFGKDLVWIRSLATRLERSEPSTDRKHKASAIREISEEMSQVVRRFLCPRAAEVATPLEGIVDRSVLTIRRIHRSCRIARSVGEEVAGLVADERVGDILTNLLGNAVEASPAEAVISVSVHAAEGAIRIEVADEGGGMEPSTLARCFEQGFTTKSSVGGTGTGLYASRRVADSIGAMLEVRSSPGEGTVAILTAPALVPAPT